LTALALWGLVLAVSKYVSLASIAAAIILPFAVWFCERQPDHDGRDDGAEFAGDLQTQGEHPAPAHGRRSRIGKKKT
jgi:hypothetical protein